MSYFSPYSHSKNKIEVELDLSTCTTKSDLKNATGVNKSQFAKKHDLPNLKLEVDKLDIDKLAKLGADELKPVPTDLSKLSNVVSIFYTYFRPCFSIICSGYDHTIIKNNQTLNCYSFLQKCLLKIQIYKLVIGSCGSSIYNYNNKFEKNLSTFGQ